MHDLSNQPLNDDRGDQQSLEQTDRAALVQQEPTDHRIELYARLRSIIDNATESIRVLKDENTTLATQNTEMTDRISTLEYRIRAVTADLASDELALRQSAEVLERVLQGTPTGTGAPVAADASPETTDPVPSAMENAPSAMVSPEIYTAMAEPEPEAVMAEPEPEAAMPVMEQAVDPAMEETGPIPQAEPPMPREGNEDERVVAPRLTSKPDGTYTLVAYPFVRFSDLGQFQAALQRLAGVHDVQVRRFAQGTLEMRIGYSGATDLATTLRTLVTEIEDVQEEEPYQLRVRLRTSQDT